MSSLLLFASPGSRSFTADADSTVAYPYSPAPADDEVESMAQAKGHIDATVTQLFYTSNMSRSLPSARTVT